jgi:hypothetical protein
MGVVQEAYDYRPFTVTANLATGQKILAGILVTSSISGTIAVYDSSGTSTSKPVIATMSVTAGVYYPIPVGLNEGLYIVVGGTLTATAFVV